MGQFDEATNYYRCSHTRPKKPQGVYRICKIEKIIIHPKIPLSIRISPSQHHVSFSTLPFGSRAQRFPLVDSELVFVEKETLHV